jgi:hypothetical protein
VLRLFIPCLLVLMAVLGFSARASAVALAAPQTVSTAPGRQTGRDQPPDSLATEPFASHHNVPLALPRLLWDGITYPIGRAVIWEEKHALHRRVIDLLTFLDGRMGLFPNISFGGETDLGIGASFYFRRLFTRSDRISLNYINALDRNNQRGQLLYRSSDLLGGHFFQTAAVLFSRLDNDDAIINGEAKRFGVLLQLNEFQVDWQLGWKLHAGRLAPYQPNLALSFNVNYTRAELLRHKDEFDLLTGVAPTDAARRDLVASVVPSLGTTEDIIEFRLRLEADNRDHQEPAEHVLPPLNYYIPGRFITFAEGRYHFWRNIYHPKRGGLLRGTAGYGTNFDDIRYLIYEVEGQRFFRLFAKDRTLAVRGMVRHIEPLDRNDFLPYYKLEYLGGNDTLRGYERGFFRSQSALLMSAEYRYPIWDTWHAFLFWDEGATFEDYADVTWSRFKYSTGLGISFRIATTYLGKLLFAHSEQEDLLVGFTFSDAF